MSADRSFTSQIGSLKKSPKDNTFQTATDLGSLFSSPTPITLRASGKVDAKDRVDMFKLALPPGVGFENTTTSVRVKRGRILVSGYIQTSIDPQPILLESRTFSAGESTFTEDDDYFNTTPGTNYFFLRVERLKGKKVKYSVTTTYTS